MRAMDLKRIACQLLVFVATEVSSNQSVLKAVRIVSSILQQKLNNTGKGWENEWGYGRECTNFPLF